MSTLRKAARSKAKIRLGLSAVAGGGKTYSAILIAKGLTGDLSKVAIIDTENGSADLYAHMGDYNVLTLTPPFPPEKYINAIKECEQAGMEVIIIDSITHEWDGAGGCLDIVEELTKKDPKHNSYTQWRNVTPRHQAFVDAILQSPAHIITTVRRKQDYEMSKGPDGKVTVTKAGLKEITRENYEYELTTNLELDQLHNATASKDRTGLFIDKPAFTPTEETGKLIKEWCDTGVDVIPEVKKLPQLPDDRYIGLRKATMEGKDLLKQTKEKYTISANQEFEIGLLSTWYLAINNATDLMELYNDGTNKQTIDNNIYIKEMFAKKQATLKPV